MRRQRVARRGLSLSVVRRGLRLNLGASEMRLTLGVPGSGWSYRGGLSWTWAARAARRWIVLAHETAIASALRSRAIEPPKGDEP